MKHFLKGVAAWAIVMVISILIHMFFNMKGIDIDLPIGNYAEIMLTSSFAILIYHKLIGNEKNKDKQK